MFNKRANKKTSTVVRQPIPSAVPAPQPVDWAGRLAKYRELEPYEKVNYLEKCPGLVAFADRVGKSLLLDDYYRESVVSAILKCNPQLDVRNQDQQTPLMLAARGNKLETVKLLLQAGAQSDLQDSNGETALMKALLSDSNSHIHDITVAFLKAGGRPDVADNKGRTAVMLAAYRGYAETTKRLVEGGALLDVRDNKGLTALAHAIISGVADDKKWSIIKTLVFNEADIIHPLTYKGVHLTPRELAEVEGLDKAVRLLTLIEQKRNDLLQKEALDFHTGAEVNVQSTGRKLVLQPPRKP